MSVTDRQLRSFIKIAELKSISGAAESLDLTQSGVSRQLAALEEYIGTPLFHRTGRGVELTEAGKQLFAVSQPAYHAIDALVARMRAEAGAPDGPLRVATIHTLSYYFMADVIAKFLGKRPQTNLSLMGRSSPEVVELVESGRADIGFVYDTAVASDRLAIVPLFDDEMCLIAPERDFPDRDDIDVSDSCLDLVVFPTAYALRRMLEHSGMKFRPAAEAETIDAMLPLVASGFGYCILPKKIPARLLQDYRLKKIEIKGLHLARKVVAVTRLSETPSSLAHLLLDTAVSAVS